MPYEVKMVYTENPYVDILVYNTKLLGINTVLKLQEQADANETVESLKNADMLIACTEGTAIFQLFDEFSESVLRSAGFIGLPLMQALLDKNTIPIEKRNTVVKLACEEFIENYEEQNNYYRMLNGLPPLEYEDVYVKDWEPPDGIIIDLSIPIHKMSQDAIAILKTYNVLEDMYKEDPINRAYLNYLDRKIDPYAARKAGPFGVLYIPTIDDSAEIEKEYRDRLEVNINYVLKALYSDAYKYDSDYYDNIMAIFIVLNAMTDVISRVQEFIARKEVFDLRTVQYIFESYGVDFFPEIPLRYQIAMVKNLHTLLKYKSTTKCMVDICSIFGMNNIKIFKYYLLRQRNYNKATGEFSFTGNVEEDFDLKFIKVPIDEPIDNYIRDPAYQLDYDETVSSDPLWNGGLEHDYVKKQHLEYNFNYVRTKYLSIDSIYDIAKMSAQQSYFFNMLYDNMELEDMITVNIPSISDEKPFKIADVFTFLTVLTHFYYGNKDLILDTQGKVLYVNGFNFKADLAAIAETLQQMRFDKEAQELLSQFNLPTESIPTFKQLMNIFSNNMNIRDLLIAGMRNADSLRHYRPYKLLYNALMTVELTFDHFKNPETGDFYRDAEGDATYSAYLQAEDPVLYYKLVELQLIDDEESMKQQIATLIDNIVYILEEYIDTEEFEYIFHSLPAVSVDAIKEYLSSVINFYKSYKVEILGINTLYYFDDPSEGYIQLIDDILLNRWFEKNEIIALINRICEMNINITKEEKISLIEKIYFNIWTWVYKNYDEKIELKDLISGIFSILNEDEEIMMNDNLKLKVQSLAESSITLIDILNDIRNKFIGKDNINIIDRIWFGYTYDINISLNSKLSNPIITFTIDNIEIPSGNTGVTINDSRIQSFSKAVFYPNIDIDVNISCTCSDGSVKIISDYNQSIIGMVEIYTDYTGYATIITENI